MLKSYLAERALFELRQGRFLLVSGSEDGASGDLLVASLEGLTGDRLAFLEDVAARPLHLVVTQHRARAMGLPVTRPNGQRPSDISLVISPGTDAEEVLALAMSSEIARNGAPKWLSAGPVEQASLSLARAAGLLPSVLAVEVSLEPGSPLARDVEEGVIMTVSATDITEWMSARDLGLERVSQATVPLPGAEDASFVLFREGSGLAEHVAVQIGDPAMWPDPVPVRLHSACFTGDLFGSLRCDCGEQLQSSIEAFVARGGGVLLYLAQEGRGIGLGNKLRAYTLQEEGLDTVDADRMLGFGADEREYQVAVEMLRALGIQRIELYTNNPEKVRALRGAGIEVASRQPLYGALNRHNRPYVRAKVHRAGHWLEDMLMSGAISPD